MWQSGRREQEEIEGVSAMMGCWARQRWVAVLGVSPVLLCLLRTLLHPTEGGAPSLPKPVRTDEGHALGCLGLWFKFWILEECSFERRELEAMGDRERICGNLNLRYLRKLGAMEKPVWIDCGRGQSGELEDHQLRSGRVSVVCCISNLSYPRPLHVLMDLAPPLSHPLQGKSNLYLHWVLFLKKAGNRFESLTPSSSPASFCMFVGIEVLGEESLKFWEEFGYPGLAPGQLLPLLPVAKVSPEKVDKIANSLQNICSGNHLCQFHSTLKIQVH
jgi:hypothetical protein